MAEVFELRPHFEWRGLGFISQSALKLSDAYADFDAELRYAVPGVRVADPKACQCGEVLKGVIKPWECKVFGTACTPERADRHLHGLARGRLRRLLQLRPLRARAGGRVTTPRLRREQRILGIIETARAKRPQFRDERITMAHGAGGKATQTLIEGLLVPAFGIEALGGAGRRRHGRRRRRAARDDHRQLRRQADALPGRLDRRAGGQRHGQRPRRRGRAPARADACRSMLEEGLDAEELRAEVEAIAAAAARPASRSSPATPRSSSAATPTGCTSARPGVGRRRPARRRCRRDALRPGDRVLVSGSIGEHGTAIMLARGEFELDADDRVRHALAVAGASTRCSTRPGTSLRCMRDATRGGVASVLNELARASRRGDARARGATCRCDPPWPARPRCSASTRCTWPTRASSSPSSRPRRPRPRSPRCARCRAARRRRDRRGPDRAARHGARRHRLRRPARDGPCWSAIRCRGSAEGRCTSSRSPRRSSTIAVRHAGGRRVTRGGGAGRAPAPGGARRRSSSPSSWWRRARALEGAELGLEEVPAAGECRACGTRSGCPASRWRARRCGGLDVEVVRGRGAAGGVAGAREQTR